MEIHRSQGIILRAVPYQDCHHIVTLFTPHQGLLSLFIRGTHRSRHFSHALVTPLTCAEFHYTIKPSSTLCSFRDASLIDQHLSLRQSYAHLETGCALANALLATQAPNKPAPHLYALLLHYLAAIPTTSHLSTLLTSFHLKLLKHEGLLTLHATCQACSTPLTSAHLWGPDAYCPTCAPPTSLPLNPTERAHLAAITASRSLPEILTIEIPTDLKTKIDTLFAALTS